MSNVTAILFLNLNLSGYCLSSIYIVNSFPDAFKFALEIPTSTLCVVRKKQKKKKKLKCHLRDTELQPLDHLQPSRDGGEGLRGGGRKGGW